MRAGLIAVAAVVALSLAAPARAADVAVPLPSGVRVPDNHVRVLLPDGYDAEACRRYPVLYLLHGVGDTWQDWSTKTALVAYARQFPVIVVMPDGGNTPDAGWYSDWADASRQFESFHIKALVPWVDANFRTLGDGHRMIAGFSMGGFGAMSYAARHRGMFKAAASFSGIVDTMYAFPASGPFFELGSEQLGTPDDRVWGDQVADEDVWRDHNPTDRAAELKGTEVFLYSGMGAPTGANGDNPQKPVNYLTEHLVYQTNLSFIRALDAAGVAYKSDFHPGYHDWPYFEAGLRWALPQMLPLVAGQTSTCATAAAPAVVAGATLPATGGALPVTAVMLVAVVLATRRQLRLHA